MPTANEIAAELERQFGIPNSVTTRNAITAAIDAGVSVQQIQSVASVTRGNVAQFSGALNTLRRQALADPEVAPLVTLQTPEAAAGLPAGSITGFDPDAAASPASGDPVAAAIDAYEDRNPGSTFVGTLPDGRLIFETAQGEQFPLVFQNGALLDPSFVGGAGGTGGGGGGGSALGFGQLAESARQFDISQNLRERQFAEDTRQFGLDEAFRRDQLRQQGQQFEEDLAFQREGLDLQRGQALGFIDGAPTLDRERFGEDVRQFDLGFGENVRQFDISTQEQAAIDRATLAENARQANLDSATSAFGDVASITPQLGQLALQGGEFTRDLLRSAPDYLARAFFQQGQDSPLPQVSQADILNSLRQNIENINQTIAGFNPQVGAFQPPPAFQTLPAFQGFQMPAPTVESGSPGPLVNTAKPLPGGFTQDASGQFRGPVTQDTLRQLRQQRGMADGGQTDGQMIRVGEAGEETIVNPTNAPLFVIPEGKAPKGAKKAQTGGVFGGVPRDWRGPMDDFDPSEMAHLNNQLQAGQPLNIALDNVFAARTGYTGGGAYGSGGGGGLFGFNVPGIPTPQAFTQDEIQALERRVRPPSVNTVLQGGMAGSPRFGFDLFTPQQIRSLTPESREALGTTLATQFNETLDNVGFAQQQRFGPTRQRGRARQLAGFV